MTPKYALAVCTSVMLALTISGCSDDEEKAKAAAEQTPVSHTLLNAKVTDIEKQKFEHDFANQCEERELKNSVNKEDDKERIEEACTCIATFMMKDLTAIEAEKFITEHENAQSLRIKYENAAYHCLQENAPKGPNFTRK
ncbi:MAG: hypothetical protein ABL925_09640 [Methylococcales bacterium]